MLSFRQLFGVRFHVFNIAVKLVWGFHFHRSIYPLDNPTFVYLEPILLTFSVLWPWCEATVDRENFVLKFFLPTL